MSSNHEETLKAGEPITLEKPSPSLEVTPAAQEYREQMKALVQKHLDSEVIGKSSLEDCVEIKKPRGYQAPNTLLTQNTTLKLYQYVQRLVELGASVGGLGEVDINPTVKPINEAFHHVLAGGKVTIILERPGDPTIVQELNTLIDEGYHEANEINKAAGYRITLEL